MIMGRIRLAELRLEQERVPSDVSRARLETAHDLRPLAVAAAGLDRLQLEPGSVGTEHGGAE
jgi:hypothetical protein